MRKKKIINLFAEINIKLNRGVYLIGSFKNAIYIGTALKLMFNLNVIQAIISALLCMFLFYIVGYIDLRFFHLFQTEAVLNSSKYNPFLNRIRKIK